MAQNKEFNKPRNWVSDRTLAARYEVARSTIWAWSRSGKLPKPKKLSANITRWDDAEAEKSMEG